MDTKYKLVRPVSLVEGDEYLLNERHEAAGELALVHVIFIAYCSSPAFVIVSNGNERLRCPRDDVFMRAWSNAESPSGLAYAFSRKSPILFHMGKIEISGQISIDESELQMDFVQASGPGGQNVNKVASAVQLRFDAASSPSLPEDVRKRLKRLAGKRMTSDGVLIIEASQFRTQERNRQDALERLVALLRQAARKPRVRRKTRPTEASKRKRLESKRRRGEIKRLRRSPPPPED